MIESFKKSQFLSELYEAALAFNSDKKRSPKKDDDYRASTILEKRGLQPINHRWVQGLGYIKSCSVARAVLFLAAQLLREEMISVKDAVANAAFLQESNEAAWEEYEFLLNRQRDDEKLAFAS